jgi:hypothetical protein
MSGFFVLRVVERISMSVRHATSPTNVAVPYLDSRTSTWLGGSIAGRTGLTGGAR